jgi:hypothetical protein
VWANVQDDDQIFEVESCQPPISLNALYLDIICSMVGLDGYDFVGKKSYSLQIPHNTGQRPLRDLPVILLDYYPEGQPLLARMGHRGSGFRELCLLNPGSKTMREYEGPCFVTSEGQEKLIDISGRIVTGPLSYGRHSIRSVDHIFGKRDGELFFGSPPSTVLEVTLIFFSAQFPRLSSRDINVQPEGDANQAIKELAGQGPPPSRLLHLVADTKAFLESDR